MSLSHLPLSSAFQSLPVARQSAKVRPQSLPSHSVAFAGEGTSNQDQLSLSWRNLHTEGGSPEEAERYLPTLRKVMDHAQKAQRFFPNLSHRHYGAAVEMNNGVEAMGTNVEASRQAVQCDLRYATTNAFNQSVALQPVHALVSVPADLKVKTVFLVNANLKGDRPVPCADCQEWMAGRFYSPDTKVVSLEQELKSHDPVVRIRTVADMLPLHMGRSTPVKMTTDKAIKSLPIETSATARLALERAGLGLSPKLMRTMLEKARAAYLQNDAGSADSGLKTGVCVNVGPKGTLHADGRFDWSTRWFEAADLRAAAKGFDETTKRQKEFQRLAKAHWVPAFAKKWLQSQIPNPTIQAIAYFGDDLSQPAIPSLGRMARRRGSSDTLVLTVENDVIQCRTIADFMPEMYQTREPKH